MYAGSVMWGFGLALMMTAGGSYLSLSLTKETAGWHSGIYQLGLSSGTLFGNVANLLFLKYANVTALFGFFISMSLCSVIVGCLLPKVLGDSDGTEPEMSLTIFIKGYKEVFQCRPYVLGIPLYIYTAMWLTHIFWFTNVYVGKSYGEHITGAVMIGFAITGAMAAVIFGRVVDWLGCFKALLVALIPVLTTLVIMATADRSRTVCYVVACIMGMADAALWTVVNAYIAPLDCTYKALMFAFFQSVQGIAASLLTITVLDWSLAILASAVCVTTALALGFMLYSSKDTSPFTNNLVGDNRSPTPAELMDGVPTHLPDLIALAHSNDLMRVQGNVAPTQSDPIMEIPTLSIIHTASPESPSARSGGENKEDDSYKPLLSLQQMDILSKHLPPRFQNLPWKCLYSTRLHGTSYRTLMQKCSTYKPVLFVIQDVKDQKIGAFMNVTVELMKEGSYGGNGETFVFTTCKSSMTEGCHTLQVFRWSRRNKFFLHFAPDYFVFGGGGHPSIRVEESLLTAATYPCTTFESPALLDADNVELLHMEAWSFE